MKAFGRLIIAASAALLFTTASFAQPSAQPLFSSDDMLRLKIRGPIAEVTRGSSSAGPRDAMLTVAATGETHAIRLSPRGITRLKRDVCQFPPLRVELSAPPAAGTLFQGQRRLKLVTHCRSAASFQQYLLLEYAAYRLFNQLTPTSFRVRLATIDYVDGNDRPVTSRVGFFIEDHDAVAVRNGMRVPTIGERIPMSSLSPRDSARFALFEYLIANLDWSMVAGPKGDRCCHNARLIAPAGARGASVVPVPYDFDFSGLVDAPYATPPEVVNVPSVRSRYYRGYCRHNGEALALAQQFRAARPAMLATLQQIPGLEERSRIRAANFLDGFFADIATDSKIASKLFRTCLD